MNKLSVLCMKVIRRTISKLQNWYRKTAFLSGLKKHGTSIDLTGNVYLWNDNVTVGDNTRIYQGVTLWGKGSISIGASCEIGINTTIYASENVVIGDHVLIAAQCYIIDSDHGIKKNLLIQGQPSVCKGPVIIEDDVWLGAGVKVLSGVHIGRGAVIGAASLVNCDIPENAVAAGVPAKVIKYRE